MNRERAKSGFSLAELLVVLGVAVVLISIFVPFVRSSREASHRSRCEDNLRQINDAFRLYFRASDFNYPRTRASTETAAWTAFTGPDDANPFADDSKVAVNDVTASLFLLVRSKHITDLNVFVCPSSSDYSDEVKDASKRSNFRSTRNLSYGYALPFSLVPEYRLNDTMPARCAILADKAPAQLSDTLSSTSSNAGAFRLRYLNSPNHRGAGQNVLFADGSVRFEITPFCGVTKPDHLTDPGDNIFSALSDSPLTTQVAHDSPGVASPAAGPSYAYDSVLVPASDFSR